MILSAFLRGIFKREENPEDKVLSILLALLPDRAEWEIRRELSMIGLSENVPECIFSALSQGEQTKVLLTALFLKDNSFPLIDEPTNHLDIKYQFQLMDIVKGLNLTVIAAIHDLNIAAMYCDRLLVVENGLIIKSGTPEEVLTPEFIKEVYEVDADVIKDEKGEIHILYHPAYRKVREDNEESSNV